MGVLDSAGVLCDHLRLCPEIDGVDYYWDTNRQGMVLHVSGKGRSGKNYFVPEGVALEPVRQNIIADFEGRGKRRGVSGDLWKIADMRWR